MPNSNRIKLNKDAFRLRKADTTEQILKGLPRKKFGFVVAAPNVGKSYSCLTIAYEVATGLPLFGVTAHGTPQKVLYWPCEDGIEESIKRIEKTYSTFTDKTIDLLEQNFELYVADQAICSPSGIDDIELQKLISDAQHFDLVIIDTIREASGACDEVKDDRIIKRALQTLAKEADVAVLCTHHLTKEAARGNERITNVSASGLSETLANSRYQLFLDKKRTKSNDYDEYFLSHIKDNFVEKEDKLFEVAVNWTVTDLPFCNQNALDLMIQGVIAQIEPDTTVEHVYQEPVIKAVPVVEKPLEEPKTVDMSTVTVSKESIVEAKKFKEKTDIFTDERKERLRKFRQKQTS